MGEINASAQRGPERETTIIVPFTEYEWWLIRWADNAILCRVLVDHEGVPLPEEVQRYCTPEVYDQWVNTPPCVIGEHGVDFAQECPGLYFHFISSQQTEREMLIELPPPAVYVSLEGCSPVPPENLCPTIPNLLLTGEEPLPNEQITAIRGFIEANPFSCEASTCSIPLVPTNMEGVEVEFWGESSFGDTTERYKAEVRVIDTGVADQPGGGGWYVDVISSQWRGAALASCARTWQAFPPLGGPPEWLSTPSSPELLASDNALFYLAGRLISQELVDVSACPTGGLLPNGYADSCGLEKARPLVADWQNQFDTRILEVSMETSVPAHLMKNLFLQESQFWPGVFRVPNELGLGQITDNGAETILLWNKPFFNQFCPLVFTEDTCQRGYLRLPDSEKAMLRGALALQAKTDCPDCPTGIDLSNANLSVRFFADTLLANCEQVSQIVFNATARMAGEVSNYEDLWRLTIANYHAGPGCLSYAVFTSWQGDGVLTWDQVSENFTPACEGAVPYVDKITNVPLVSTLGEIQPTLTAPPATSAVTPTPAGTPYP
jgi:hypothetical protein